MNRFARALIFAVCSLAYGPCFAGVPNGVVYHVFTQPVGGLNPDGANPAAGLVLSQGLLCGTTVNGGLQGAGTAFNLAPDASGFNPFRTFAKAPDGANPQGELTFSGSRLFGTTFAGGSNGVGAAFAGQTNSVSIIESFAALSPDNATNSGGAGPMALLAVFGGTVFGATSSGGAAGNGTIFSMSTNGSAFTVLHDFTALDSVSGTNTDGATPMGGLVLSGGALYGTTSAGGAGGNGTIFSISTNGTNFATLHDFSAMDPSSGTNSDGAIPMSGLLLTNNTLYGTAIAGGQSGNGTIFSITTSGTGFTVLHHFSGTDPVTGTNADGASPCAVPALAGSVLFGTAAAGGEAANGTVFSITTNRTQFQTLHSFSALDPATGTNADGSTPTAGLLLLGNSLYGTAFNGGPGGVGVVFAVHVPYAPAVITNIVLNPGGNVTLSFVGGPGSLNIVQASGSLKPPVAWQNVSTNIADAQGAWQFTDTNTISARFYRSYAP
jgi:uncharacterized repeat protein (TIGR03803 family)